MAGALALLADANADAVVDIAVSHALLAGVAAGRWPPALRLFRPPPTVAFGRLDALRPGFERACAAACAHGFEPVLRSVGGHAAVFDDRCVVAEHFTRERDATAGLQARFERQAALVRDALTALGVDARIGELPGEYCPGAHSVNARGRVKLAGIAQRVVRGGALASAVLVAGGGPELRAVIADVYGELAIPVDAGVAGAVDEERPGVDARAVVAALRARYAEDAQLAPAPLDAGLLAAAATLAPRHRVA
jgi:lipoate-protein ligase A